MVVTKRVSSSSRVFAVFFSVMVFNHHLSAQTASEQLGVHADLWYQCSSNRSYLDAMIVRRSVHCAGQCLRNSKCQTATFNQADHSCLLYSESIGLGQQMARKDAFIFTRQGKR